MTLSPTLWRTCRVLMNPVRLRCLQAVLRKEGRCVTEIAREARVSVPVASQYLRDLQARGLLTVRRRSRWVLYSGRPDLSVGHAAPLLAAVGTALMDRTIQRAAIHQALDGLSHPRRITILRCLSRSRELGLSDLRAVTGISILALWRHLKRLERCGWVHHHETEWSLAPTPSPFARQLLAEADR